MIAFHLWNKITLENTLEKFGCGTIQFTSTYFGTHCNYASWLLFYHFNSRSFLSVAYCWYKLTSMAKIHHAINVKLYLVPLIILIANYINAIYCHIYLDVVHNFFLLFTLSVASSCYYSLSQMSILCLCTWCIIFIARK